MGASNLLAGILNTTQKRLFKEETIVYNIEMNMIGFIEYDVKLNWFGYYKNNERYSIAFIDKKELNRNYIVLK